MKSVTVSGLLFSEALSKAPELVDIFAKEVSSWLSVSPYVTDETAIRKISEENMLSIFRGSEKNEYTWISKTNWSIEGENSEIACIASMMVFYRLNGFATDESACDTDLKVWEEEFGRFPIEHAVNVFWATRRSVLTSKLYDLVEKTFPFLTHERGREKAWMFSSVCGADDSVVKMIGEKFCWVPSEGFFEGVRSESPLSNSSLSILATEGIAQKFRLSFSVVPSESRKDSSL